MVLNKQYHPIESQAVLLVFDIQDIQDEEAKNAGDMHQL
jgi:hypothetical protein